MNCKKIQELILTDYLDQEMAEDKQKEVESHIASCAHCAEFLATAKKAAVEPLANITKNNLSQDMIWSKINQEIQAEKESLLDYNQEPGFFEKIKNILFFPKPRLALSTLAVIGLFLLVFNITDQSVPRQNNQIQTAALNNQQVIENKSIEAEREEYLSYLLDQDDDAGYGTSLENYFL